MDTQKNINQQAIFKLLANYTGNYYYWSKWNGKNLEEKSYLRVPIENNESKITILEGEIKNGINTTAKGFNIDIEALHQRHFSNNSDNVDFNNGRTNENVVPIYIREQRQNNRRNDNARNNEYNRENELAPIKLTNS